MKYMPYMHFYLDQVDLRKHDVHVLYWNRDCALEIPPEGVTCHEFAWPMEDDIPKLRKLGGFGAYQKFARALLRREKFDFVVVMHSLPGVLLSDILIRQYRGRFIFDYRDYTYESFPPYRRIIHSLVHASRITFVSSDSFRDALPALNKIYTSHNLRPDALSHGAKPASRGQKPLRIAFWGYIRHEQLNRQIIRQLARDDRFQLHFYGREQAIALNLKEYARSLGADNVVFHGAYDPGDQDTFAMDTDLLHNLYSNTEAPSQRWAMTNKYYDGLVYRLPQLCMKDSFMGGRVERDGLGLVCDPDAPDFADRIWDYYKRLDMDAFGRRCDEVLARILCEYEEGRSVIEDAIASACTTE